MNEKEQLIEMMKCALLDMYRHDIFGKADDWLYKRRELARRADEICFLLEVFIPDYNANMVIDEDYKERKNELFRKRDELSE